MPTTPTHPTCFVTVDIPWPLSDDERRFFNVQRIVGFQPLALQSTPDSDGKTITWVPGFEQGFTNVLGNRVNAPELFSGPPEERELGKASRDFLAELLPEGKRCRIATEGDITTFGRYVADIELEDGTDVTTALIESGYSAPYPR